MDPVGVLGTLAGLGLLIGFHELGHLIVAKLCGVSVEKFSIGFGPVLVRKRWGETDWVISAIPFGGYVSMLRYDVLDDDSKSEHDDPKEDSEVHDPIECIRGYLRNTGRSEEMVQAMTSPDRLIQNKPIPQRLAIFLAGPLKNVLLAWVIVVGLLMNYGINELHTPPKILKAHEGGAAEAAGLQPGDIILMVNGRDIGDSNDLAQSLRDGPAVADVRLQRGNTELNFKVGQSFETQLAHTTRFPGFFESSKLAANSCAMGCTLIIKELGKLVVGKAENAGGPIKIVTALHESSRKSFRDYWNLVAMLSLNLAILNLLPIANLDGGHIFLDIWRLATGKPLPSRWLVWYHVIGIILVLGLVLVLVVLDSLSLLGW